jgi:hypothetical protein
MKFYESRDFKDEVILRSQSKKDVIEAFRRTYPSYDVKHIGPFIYEIEVVFDICLPEYEGILSKKKWKEGKIQEKVCKVITHTHERLGKERTAKQIAKLWRVDPFEIKKNIKTW